MAQREDSSLQMFDVRYSLVTPMDNLKPKQKLPSTIWVSGP